MSSTLEQRLQAALDSRATRSILRRVEQPAPFSPPTGSPLVDFSSNDYLSLATNPDLRALFLRKLADSDHILGSTGSRLLDGNSPAHFALEERLRGFFKSPAALLFNSGFDANVALFTTLPQDGDFIILDELIHASVWDGCRASRAKERIHVFRHNSVDSLRECLEDLVTRHPPIKRGESTVIVAVETLYSMDGDFAPLPEILSTLQTLLPLGNGRLIADEAHATGLYGPQGRGIVALLGLEDRVLARLHTFGKALASNGAVVIASPLIRNYLVNYARSLIFTTALSHANVISIDCSFDMLETGEASKLSQRVQHLCGQFLREINQRLKDVRSSLAHVPSTRLTKDAIVSPIIPLLTSHPRPLASFLLKRGYLARPITWPTVPKGQDRVRICIHAGNTENEVAGLVEAIMEWVKSMEPERSKLARL